MSTETKIGQILLYTQDARQKAKDEYWIECKISMEKAIRLIDSL